MAQSNKETIPFPNRRQRLHELLIALIHQQEDLELMDDETPKLGQSNGMNDGRDPARWLERNRRLMNRYQALVRSAITLDALLDSEQSEV